MPRKKTHKEFLKDLEKRYEKKEKDNPFEFLSKYDGARKKIKTKCKVCEEVWTPTPNNLLNGSGCPTCRTRRLSWSIEDFKEEMKKRTDWKDYKVVGKYNGYNKPIKMEHKNCGNEWDVMVNNFLNGTGCPKCAHNLKTHEEFVEEIKELTNGKYKVLSKYNGVFKSVKFLHKKCGNVFEKKVYDFLHNGSWCKKC